MELIRKPLLQSQLQNLKELRQSEQLGKQLREERKQRYTTASEADNRKARRRAAALARKELAL